MKLEEMALILGKAAIVFPTFNLSEQAIIAWYDLFKNENPLTLEAAMRATVKEPGRAFFPTPGEVVKNLLLVKKPSLPMAEDVWAELMAFANRGDEKSARALALRNPAAEMALRRVTFRQMQYSDIEKELPWRQKDFIETYNSYAEKSERQEAVAISHEEAKKTLSEINQKLIAVK